MIIRALLEEFPELDAARVRVAVERGAARAASASLDTEGYKVVDMHLARVEETEESSERAHILRDLSENLEQRGDLDRSLVVRLSAFNEAASAEDIEPLLRLARVTNRWAELPLDAMNGLVDTQHDAAVGQLTALAAAWTQVGRAYYAADCLERVLLLAPADQHANDALETFYRSTGEWPVLIDLLGRQAVHVEKDKDRAELFREIALIYERELDDADAALDAYREADRLQPDHPEVLDAIARLVLRVGDSDGEALTALERLARVTHEPTARARALCRAAEIAKLYDWDKAQKLYERAHKDDPAFPAPVEGLATLLRDKGLLAEAIALLVTAAGQAQEPLDRSRWLADAADYHVALGDTDSAMQLYRDARVADPANHRAGVALVELCIEGGDLRELVPILDELCRTTDDPARLRTYLLQRSKVAAELGDRTGARNALSRAIDLDPHDLASRRELADMLWQAQAWAKARALIESLFDHEDLLPEGAGVELHYRAAVCAFELGDTEGALMHAGATLALAPDHREALLMKAELDKADPVALAADQLALANIAPPEEKAQRFTALGDRYMELGDRATAREMYREALVYRPGDHLLLTKFLELVADEGDWSYSLDLVKRLIETEQSAHVRARYRHTAAMIARDELDDAEQTLELLDQAIEDDPLQFGAADDLEAFLAQQPDALMRFYYRRLEHVRAPLDEGRPRERLRLWDNLGDLCVRVGRYDDAVAAFEVALSLDPDNLERRERLADLYAHASPSHDAAAIAQHQTVLRHDKKRVESYKALHALYARTDQPEKAQACDDALTVLRAHLIDERIEALFERAPSSGIARGALGATGRALGNDDWMALARLDVDLQLSALFALVAPPFAVERARLRPPQTVPTREAELPAHLHRVLGQVLTSFGIGRPPVYIDPEQVAAAKVAMRARAGVLVPVLLLGKAVLAPGSDDLELAFQLARQLADLRTDRIARLLCPRANELAQIIELAAAVPGDATTHAARWLATSLHPVELSQAQAIGTRLRDRAVHPMSAAVSWLAATERAADRIGFVVTGDLATCVRVLEREPTSEAGRILELAWSSVTEDVLAVRGRLEGWPASA